MRISCSRQGMQFLVSEATETVQKEISMSTPPAARRHRRTSALSALPWIVLLPLAQAGLGYLSARSSSPWYWLVGTPLSYLLIAMLAAFGACGGLAPVPA